ncbi:hypothetical protein ACJJTC_005407 [Scirpophaga incertulas]
MVTNCAAKKAGVESNPMHDEPGSTSFQIFSPTQSVRSNLADILTNRIDSEEETENDDSNIGWSAPEIVLSGGPYCSSDPSEGRSLNLSVYAQLCGRIVLSS